jgi:hypothetical protein
MVFEKIDALRREFTDKYVVVDESRPELRRFAGATGRVKTINMNGRALVQFDVYGNIGWYDIALDYLRVVDAPPPRVEETKAERKAAPKPVEKSAVKPDKPVAAKTKAAAPAAAAEGKKSVQEILAAARAAKGKTEAPSAEKPKPAPNDAAKPAGKMSTPSSPRAMRRRGHRRNRPNPHRAK